MPINFLQFHLPPTSDNNIVSEIHRSYLLRRRHYRHREPGVLDLRIRTLYGRKALASPYDPQRLKLSSKPQNTYAIFASAIPPQTED